MSATMTGNVANFAGSTAFAIAFLVSSALRIFSDLLLIFPAWFPPPIGGVLLDPFRLSVELGLVFNDRALLALVPPADAVETVLALVQPANAVAPGEISLPYPLDIGDTLALLVVFCIS